jgi:hypothetical protein
MKLFKWDEGRQYSGYRKMLLAVSTRLKFDVWLIKIPDGSGVPSHTDPATPGYEHHRLNIMINKPGVGSGKMQVKGPAKIFLFGRAILFRPDLYEHWMTPVDFIWSEDSTYLLSIGWLRRGQN